MLIIRWKSVPRTVTIALLSVFGLIGSLELGAPSVAAAQVTPPSILEVAEPNYPQAAIDANRGQVSVLLRIVIETDGSVSEATVVDARGDGLDEAASDALRRYRFTPAMRDGVPMRVALRFELVMTPPAPATDELDPALDPDADPDVVDPELVPPPPVPTGRIVGQLLDTTSGEPMPEVDVGRIDETGAELWTRTDAEGRFVFEALPTGTYRLVVRPLGLDERVETESVVDGEELAVTYRIVTVVVDAPDENILGARAVAEPPPREITRRTLPREVLNNVPGTRGDPLRAIEILPGIARPPFGFGALIVRGSAPGDSEYLLGGVPVPAIYHFGGLTSVINGRLLERIDFYPGNFSSRYGRKMGGIVEIETRDPQTDRIHGNIETSVIDTSVLIEGPITPRFSLAGSFRRSLIDLVLGAVLENADVNVTAAPVYYDYQLFGTWRPTDRDRVRFRIYGSDDRFRLILGANASDDPATRGGLGLTTHFDHFQTNWERQIDTRLKVETVALIAPQRLTFRIGTLANFALEVRTLYLRNEWTANVNERFRIIAGTDISLGLFDITYTGGALDQDQSQQRVSVNEGGFNIRPAVYVDAAYTVGRFVLTGALRLDYYSEIQGWSLDPRLVTNYQLTPEIRLKAAVGLFSQPPEFQDSSPGLGNPNLEPIHSVHYGTGVEWTPIPGTQFGLDGFYKQLWNRVVPTTNGSGTRFENTGIGRIYGMEVSGRVLSSPERPYYGYLSYTLMRSERQDHPGDQTYLFAFDQTHIFTASFSYTFRRHNWQLGATLRLVSGNPNTPVVNNVFDPLQQSIYPISGITGASRNPLFNRLDVRVEKQWVFETWKLALFLDVQNAYNQGNQEALLYNYDYTLSGAINGLPIIPGLGVRGEF